MSLPPKISFLLCTRNRAEVARQCVAHILSSSRQDIELIVRDNFSSDDTFTLLSGIEDARLRLYSVKENQGTLSFFEIPKLASGEIVTWISDEDDFSLDEIDFVLEKFRVNPDCNVMFGSIVVGPAARRLQFEEETIDDPVRACITALSFSGCGGLFVRRSALPAAHAFRIASPEQGYLFWNYYPVGFFASRCVSDKLITTSRTVVTQARFGRTTNNWSETSVQDRVRLPHYYPESTFDRLASNIANIFMKKMTVLQKLRTSISVIWLFWLQSPAFTHPGLISLLKENYADRTVEAYVDHVSRLGMAHRFGRFCWAFKSTIRLAPAVLSNIRSWRRLMAG